MLGCPIATDCVRRLQASPDAVHSRRRRPAHAGRDQRPDEQHAALDVRCGMTTRLAPSQQSSLQRDQAPRTTMTLIQCVCVCVCVHHHRLLMRFVLQGIEHFVILTRVMIIIAFSVSAWALFVCVCLWVAVAPSSKTNCASL